MYLSYKPSIPAELMSSKAPSISEFHANILNCRHIPSEIYGPFQSGFIEYFRNTFSCIKQQLLFGCLNVKKKHNFIVLIYLWYLLLGLQVVVGAVSQVHTPSLPGYLPPNRGC